MTTTITARFATPEEACWIADMPQLRGNGHKLWTDGNVLELTSGALAVLRDLPEDSDGHYDGQDIWMGGMPVHVRALG